MDLSFTDEQQFLRESVRGTIDREAPLSRVREWVLGDRVEHGDSLALAVRQGWTGIGIPEEMGGQGGGLLELAILAEELGRGAVPADGLYATLLAQIALGRCEHDTALAQIEPLALGETFGALASPGDVPPDTPPQHNGELSLVLGAPSANLFLAWDGEALELHPAETTQIRPRQLVDRTRAVADVTLAADPLQRFEHVGPDQMRTVAAWAAVLIAADALGAAQRMLELTVEYVSQRIQFGVPVGSFQAVKHTAAEMLVAIEGTRAAVHYAAWAVGAHEPGSELDAWVAKTRSAKAASYVADNALFLHGAVGYTWEHDLQLVYKRAHSDGQLLGGPRHYDHRIADGLELVPAAQPSPL
jgi:alkylation response protein AidB-like acyl-CoA dehydrogenase